MQAKLLRVLELGEVHRVGSLEPRRVNVHVIAATNRDLRAEVAAGRFRSDLYYRLNIVEVKLPPLRERREDIPYLTAAFVRETSERLQKPLLGLTPGAERLLTAAPWEGNVRELRNVIERACILTDGDFITERELAISMPVARAGPGSGAPVGGCAAFGTQPCGETDLLVNVEREHIQRALVRADGNKKAAAQDARPQPPRALPASRAAGSVLDDFAAPRRGADGSLSRTGPRCGQRACAAGVSGQPPTAHVRVRNCLRSAGPDGDAGAAGLVAR